LHATSRWENQPVASGVAIADLDEDEIHLTEQLLVIGGDATAVTLLPQNAMPPRGRVFRGQGNRERLACATTTA
jgi:hypothetical protein